MPESAADGRRRAQKARSLPRSARRPAESVVQKIPEKVKTLLVGKPRDLADQSVFHHVSLVAFLAWVGLGADGLSQLLLRSARGVRNLWAARVPGDLPVVGRSSPCSSSRPAIGTSSKSFPAAAADTWSPRSSWGRAWASCRAARCWSTTC